MTETDKAWTAGFLDGEAYIGLTRLWYGKKKARYYYRVVVHVGQVSPVPLQKLAALFGGTVRRSSDKYGHHYQWVRNGQNAIDVLETVIEYLVAKRKQAELVIEFYALRMERRLDAHTKRYQSYPEEVHIQQAALHAAVMELNKRRIHRDRLSEEAPAKPGDAIVGSDGNSNHQSMAEMPMPSERVQ